MNMLEELVINSGVLIRWDKMVTYGHLVVIMALAGALLMPCTLVVMLAHPILIITMIASTATPSAA